MRIFNIHLFFLFIYITFFQLSCVAHEAQGVVELELQVRSDLQRLSLPPVWKRPKSSACNTLDVAIIGGGMAGMTAGFALIKEGIKNIAIFDENSTGLAGPWRKTARMHHLRSSKTLMGPALGIPCLTFRCWYEAYYGSEAWDQLKFIPTEDWSNYLTWYGRVLDLPISHQMSLQAIHPADKCFELVFAHGDQIKVVYARKVVLATGREGFGGLETPAFMQHLSKEKFAHTGEAIDPAIFADKRVVVIGAGASAFDAAGEALEWGAAEVMILIRRPALPMVNKFSKFSFPGILHGFYHLDDELRCRLLAQAFASGIPPAQGGVERVKDARQLVISYDTEIQVINENSVEICVKTNQGDFTCDYIVLGTGFSVDGTKRSELQHVMPAIQLWEEHVPPEILAKMPKLGRFPYLGEHFQFLEKEKGLAPYLKNLYCFNYGAILSHGMVSGDIPGVSYGATRLATGIAADFFTEEVELYQQAITDYNIPLFNIDDYPFLAPVSSVP